MKHKKEEVSANNDTDFTVENLHDLVVSFKEHVKEVLGNEVPDNPME